jgi:hypothetical protein
MPSWKSRHFKVDARVGANNAAAVQLAQGASDHYEVIVTPMSGVPKPTKVHCVRLGGTAASYDPPPPDAWSHDFGRIGRGTASNLCTATRTVEAGRTPGMVTLRVKEVEVDDGLPTPNIRAYQYDISVTIP